MLDRQRLLPGTATLRDFERTDEAEHTMLILAGSAFAVFIVLFMAGFAVVTAMSCNPNDVATEQPKVDGYEYVLYGATLIGDGYRYYPDWRSSMLRCQDQGIRGV
jgi:hypothetical protein